MLASFLSINPCASARRRLPGVKTKSIGVPSVARRDYVFRLARHAVGRLLAGEFQRRQRSMGLDVAAHNESASVSREHLKVTGVHAEA